MTGAMVVGDEEEKLRLPWKMEEGGKVWVKRFCISYCDDGLFITTRQSCGFLLN